MRDLLELPPFKTSAPDAPRESGPELRRRLFATVERLSSVPTPPGNGDAAAALAEALGTSRGDRLDSFAEGLQLRPGGATPAALYACAAEAVAEGEISSVSVGLVALLDGAATRQAALLGLAICAARADRHDEALAMALSSWNGEDTHHPRAFTVAGVAEHLRGNGA